jgi:hypothetical protein
MRQKARAACDCDLAGDAVQALPAFEFLHAAGLMDRLPALCHLGLCGQLEIACGASRPELEQLFERGELVAGGCGWGVPEGDPLECADIVGEVRPGRRLLACRLVLDRRRDLLQPPLELTGGA